MKRPTCDYCPRPAVYQEPSIKIPPSYISRGTRAERLRVIEYPKRSGFICADDIEPGYAYGLRPVML